MKLKEFRKLIQEEVQRILKEDSASMWSRKDTDALEAMLQRYSDYLNSSETKSEYDQYGSLLKKHTKKVDDVLFDVKKGWM